jgi:phosphatidylserine decarboxylase
VAGIETVWSGPVAPPSRLPQTLDFDAPPERIELAKGEEMGRFQLGSTVILLLPPGTAQWDPRYQAGTATRLGEALGQLAAAQTSASED